MGFIKGASMGRLGYIKAFDRNTLMCELFPGMRRVVLQQQPLVLPSVQQSVRPASVQAFITAARHLGLPRGKAGMGSQLPA